MTWDEAKQKVDNLPFPDDVAMKRFVKSSESKHRVKGDKSEHSVTWFKSVHPYHEYEVEFQYCYCHKCKDILVKSATLFDHGLQDDRYDEGVCYMRKYDLY